MCATRKTVPARPATAATSATAEPALAAAPADADGFVDDYLPALLARASQLISGEFHRQLKKPRVPVIYWRIMASLWEYRSLGVTELADVVLLKQPTCSKVVARMEAAGLVQRVADDTDRRSTRISLTGRGRELAGPLVAQASNHDRQVRAPLGPASERVLIATLKALIAQHGQ